MKLSAIKPYAKAAVAGAAALAGGIAVGYADDRLTAGEAWSAIASALVAIGATYGVRNAPPGE